MNENTHCDVITTLVNPVKINDSKIYFKLDNDWAIEISEKGINFNHEKYPQWSENDFAKEFMNILEKNFIVNFIEINGSSLENLGWKKLEKYECDFCKGTCKCFLRQKIREQYI